MRVLVLALVLLATQIAAAAEDPLRLDVLLPLTGGSAGVIPAPRSFLFAASATLEANNISKLAAIRALGYQRMAVLTETDANPAQLAALGDALPKVLVVQGLPYQARVMPAALQAPAAEYLGALKAAGLQPLPSHVYAWDPARIVVSALRALPPNPSADQLRAYLLQLHGFAGLSGVYDFRSGDRHGLTDTTTFPLLRWDAHGQTWLPFDTKPAANE